MSREKVSRRLVMGALGVGAATAVTATATRVALATTPKSVASGPSDQPKAAVPRSTAASPIAPLVAGSMLGRWKVERTLPLENGAMSVVLSDEAGTKFQLDVVAKGNATGPGHTEHFEVLLANHGDGSMSTFEDHGLAAMALAEVIRGNEHHVSREGFLTQAERSSQARLHT